MVLSVDVRWKPAAQHRAVARSGSDWKDERGGLQATNPDGIESLVVNPEWSEESADRHGHVGIRDVVDLSILDFLADAPAKRPAARWSLKVALELTSGLHQPAFAEWDQQNRSGNGRKLRVPQMPVREETNASGKDWHRPLRNVRLCREQPRNTEANSAEGESKCAAGKRGS